MSTTSTTAATQGGSGGPSALAFRVMRLCRPTFQVDTTPLRFDPFDLLAGEDLFDDPVASDNFANLISAVDSKSNGSDSSADLTYRTRLLLDQPSDAMGIPGLLVLPQSFGAIYLGETFCSYISINNSSNFEVREIHIKAEIQTERQRIMLLDTSKSPVESIRAGGRYDFIVEHDVKELGAHTLVCTALYNDNEGERKYLPQFFKFMVANPLSVRTKVRVVKDTTFLEACLENNTKSNLYMDQVDFEPAQNWGATLLNADLHYSQKGDKIREVFKPPTLIRSGGGIHNYLYELKMVSHGSPRMNVEGSNILGKLQITWRTNLGEPGRLQTQQILGSPIRHKEIDLQAMAVPSVISLEKPFEVRLNLTNQTDRLLGPFEVWLSQSGLSSEHVVMVNGIQTMVNQLHSVSVMQIYYMLYLELGKAKRDGVVSNRKQAKNTYVMFFPKNVNIKYDIYHLYISLEKNIRRSGMVGPSSVSSGSQTLVCSLVYSEYQA